MKPTKLRVAFQDPDWVESELSLLALSRRMARNLRSRKRIGDPSETSQILGDTSQILEDVESTFQDLDDKCRREKEQLGYKHWFITVLALTVIYGLVVLQDHRLPDVEPADQFEKFSEVRAREFLNKITALGPRPSGSIALEVHAVKILNDKLAQIKQSFERTGVNRIETDIQRPVGCFNLEFLSAFTLCYHKVTNVLVRIGSKKKESHNAVLLNCHFDTLPDTPGATDDAVSCAIMMETLEILSKRPTELENDIIFLFNGAEENFLQASHGFITQHPWRHDVRAFINLEGTGSGGREILFQAGPGDSWILKAYLENAPHPHCSVVAQEIFQSSIVPSDTDFRVFRDYGRVSGLDIAYHRNGWVYHTEFDKAAVITTGSIQRAGDNLLAVSQALVRSPHLESPASFNEENKWVFFDFVGLFTIFYEISFGNIVNFVVILILAIMIAYRLLNGIYTSHDLLWAFGHNVLSLIVMAVVGLSIVGILHLFNMVMCWYAMPELVFPIYIFPMLVAGCWTHSYIADRKRNDVKLWNPLRQELIHYDAVLIYWALLLLIMTARGLASSFYMLIHVIFPLMRDPLLAVYLKVSKKPLKAENVLFTQWICLLPVIAFVSNAVMLFFDFFVPVMGRMGNIVPPELIMMPLSLLTAWTFVLFTNNLVYISRRMGFLLQCSVALFALFFVITATTSIGVPYKWSDDGMPRLRRILAIHVKRSAYGMDGSVQTSDSGLFVQSFDYRGVDDLPEHSFLQGSGPPNCTNTKDEYCQLPYYTAIHRVIPPRTAKWVPMPQPPTLPNPLHVTLDQKEISDNGRTVNISLTVKGGVDKMTYHVTPLNNYTIKEWSLTKMDHKTFGERDTYFVFLTYGAEAPPERNFWVVLEKENEDDNAVSQPSLEFSVATHYSHGRYQNSPPLLQLRALINTRRQTPHFAVGYWKWAITMIGGCSETIARLF
ncbi:unnamed protein product [Bursaphelenchus okinawaensis]|uniref:FXNA-like protease n=1 Tax=Bursaphelenchus okinawaensis TaxID=465554 RepID=A0A811K6V0_9BILA|nr:unnamed protein product [Bursaphelenchus okinawaensis]CAG9092906.1 unnamed protein product [Bursaphelenchus okinawaensis]